MADAWSSEAIDAAEYIKHLLNGGSPNGAAPKSFGEYRDIIENLHNAYDAGQTVKVKDTWRDLVRRQPELVELVSSDPTASEGWQVYTLADAYKPRPKLRYVVDGLFPLPSLSIMYGAPGTFKSLLLADLAICVASGLPWLPPLPGTRVMAKATVQVRVLWCDFDNGIRRTHERFEALAKVRNLPTAIPLSYVSMPSPWLDAGKVDTMTVLHQCIATHKAKLVCIDNLTAVKGGADENSAAMGSIMANFRRLAEDTGGANILIHHQRKDTGTNARAGDRLRGHSSIEAALDLALLVERAPQAPSVTVQSTKVRGVDVPPFGAKFSYEHQPGTTELATARFFGMAVDDKVSERAIEQVIIEIVTAHPQMNQQTLKQLVKKVSPAVSMRRIGGVIARLEQQQKLRSKPGDCGAKLYEVA